MVDFSSRVYGNMANNLLLLSQLVLTNQRRRYLRVVVEVEVLADKLILVSSDCLVEVCVTIKFVDEGLLGSQYRQEDVFHRYLQVSCIDVFEVLLEPFKFHQVFFM